MPFFTRLFHCYYEGPWKPFSSGPKRYDTFRHSLLKSKSAKLRNRPDVYWVWPISIRPAKVGCLSVRIPAESWSLVDMSIERKIAKTAEQASVYQGRSIEKR